MMRLVEFPENNVLKNMKNIDTQTWSKEDESMLDGSVDSDYMTSYITERFLYSNLFEPMS